ncbi:MAG: chromate transporter [Kiritimatiellia bacterium]|nr:chromate transporter [Kiritimatiellia bacterium]
MSIFLYLLLHFAKYGLLCFGGGYSLMPLLMADLVRKDSLLSEESFATLASIAQLTPGPIGLNTATYVGYTQAGLGGALIASLAMLLPSFLILTLAARLLQAHRDHPIVKGFLAGVRPVSLGLILLAGLIFAGLTLGRSTLQLTMPLIIILAAIGHHQQCHPLAIILGGGALGAMLGGLL